MHPARIVLRAASDQGSRPTGGIGPKIVSNEHHTGSFRPARALPLPSRPHRFWPDVGCGGGRPVSTLTSMSPLRTRIHSMATAHWNRGITGTADGRTGDTAGAVLQPGDAERGRGRARRKSAALRAPNVRDAAGLAGTWLDMIIKWRRAGQRTRRPRTRGGRRVVLHAVSCGECAGHGPGAVN